MKKLLILALLLVASPAFGLSELKHTVCPSGCDYTTLDGAITHIETTHANLVTADVYATVEISGDWTGAPDTTGVTISGITTDATRYLHIYTTGLARHDGFYGNKASAYRLEPANNVKGIESPTQAIGYIRIEGLQIRATSDTPAGAHGIALSWNSSGTGNVRIFGNIIKGNLSGTSGGAYGIQLYSVDSGVKTVYIYNNIIYDFQRSTADHRGVLLGGTASSGITVNAYNNTIINCRSGLFQSFGTFNSYNNGFLDNFEAKSGTFGGGTGDQTTTPTFVDYANDNFHLASGDTAWKDTTSDQSGGLFSSDVDGQTRSGSWDAGADEVVSTAKRRIILVN